MALANTWTDLPAFRDIEVESATLDAAIAAPSPRTTCKGPVTEVTLTLDSYVGFVEFMEIDITLEHPSIRDLEIELVSPSGVTSPACRTRLQARHSSLAIGFPSAIDGPYRFGSSKHLGENAAGVWTLRISDWLHGPHGHAQVVEAQGVRPRIEAGLRHGGLGHGRRSPADHRLDGPDRRRRFRRHQLRPALRPQQRGSHGHPDRGDRHRHGRHGHL